MRIVFVFGGLDGGQAISTEFHLRQKSFFASSASILFIALCAATLSGCAAESDARRSAAPGAHQKVASSKKGATTSIPTSQRVAATVQAGAAPTAGPFALTSPAFKDGDVWPSRFAGSDPSRTNPPCPGQNISPPLAWSSAPSATKSFAIFMSDPDGNNGLGVIHWIAYDIPLSKTSLYEGEASESPKTWVGGKNVIGSDHYFGPCGPAGHALHHYVITVIATDIPPGTLMPGLSHAEMVQQLGGHALAPASIVGRYTRPSS